MSACRPGDLAYFSGYERFFADSFEIRPQEENSGCNHNEEHGDKEYLLYPDNFLQGCFAMRRGHRIMGSPGNSRSGMFRRMIGRPQVRSIIQPVILGQILLPGPFMYRSPYSAIFPKGGFI